MNYGLFQVLETDNIVNYINKKNTHISMKTDEEIKSEIKRVCENKYSDIDGVNHETNFDFNAYVEGLKYALGEDITRTEFPPRDVVNNIIERIIDEPDIKDITVKRHGVPPKYIEVDIEFDAEIDSVEHYEELTNYITEVSIEECSDDEFVYTSVNMI